MKPITETTLVTAVDNAVLSPREGKVLRLYLGLDGTVGLQGPDGRARPEEAMVVDLAKLFGTTVSEMRQIIERALIRMDGI